MGYYLGRQSSWHFVRVSQPCRRLYRTRWNHHYNYVDRFFYPEEQVRTEVEVQVARGLSWVTIGLSTVRVPSRPRAVVGALSLGQLAEGYAQRVIEADLQSCASGPAPAAWRTTLRGFGAIDPTSGKETVMGTYGISGLGAVRTAFPTDYVPNCVENGGLLLTRDDHLEVQVHLRYPTGVTKVTRWYTPGPTGRWGVRAYAHDFWGMNRREPIFLRDFKDWIARNIRARFGADAVLIAPGVCVKTIWFRDGRRVDAPPYVPTASPAPAADSGGTFGSGSDGPASSGETVRVPAGADWRTGLVDRLAHRATPPPAASEGSTPWRPTLPWLTGGAGTPGGGVDAGGGESYCSSGGGVDAPPGTDAAAGEGVDAPPGTDGEAPPEEGISSQASWYQANKTAVWGTAAVVAIAATLFGVFKFGKKAKKNNRRRNVRRNAYRVEGVKVGDRFDEFGHVWVVKKVNKRAGTVDLVRYHTDAFGKRAEIAWLPDSRPYVLAHMRKMSPDES